MSTIETKTWELIHEEDLGTVVVLYLACVTTTIHRPNWFARWFLRCKDLVVASDPATHRVMSSNGLQWRYADPFGPIPRGKIPEPCNGRITELWRRNDPDMLPIALPRLDDLFEVFDAGLGEMRQVDYANLSGGCCPACDAYEASEPSEPHPHVSDELSVSGRINFNQPRAPDW